MIKFDMTNNEASIIKVIGVGGGGSNAVTHMFNQGIIGVDFAICNTDNQAMDTSPVTTKIQLGPGLTEGRGAGSKPNIGKEACVESIDEIKKFLGDQTKMVFITAGLGGGTGTGAAPVIAKAAQEMDILTVGIVTLPFTFEGRRRKQQAMEGLEELKKNVDTLIMISNDKLRQIHGNLVISKAFANADDVLTIAAKGIAEIITVPGYINVDFEDVNTVMRGSGVAIMGSAYAEGDNRARVAIESALNSPLLEDNDIRGAQHILLNITSGTKEITMDEIFEITEFVQEEAGQGTDLIWGNCFDESLGEAISVTLIATGFEHGREQIIEQERQKKVRVSLNDTNEVERDPIKEITMDNSIDNEPTIDNKAIVYEFEPMPSAKKDPFSFNSIEEPHIKDKPTTVPRENRPVSVNRNPDFKPTVKLNNPASIIELENQPAYLRREVNLDNVQLSSEQTMSKWTLGADSEIDETNNSFLHDNVD